MKNIYLLLKLNRYVKSFRLKSLGIFLMHAFGKRYIGVFIDPVLACNLRCRMCYFSDPVKRKTMKGCFKREDLPKLADALFHRALKLQIGCGAEPSVFPYNEDLIRLGKEKGVPYISMTSNATLFSTDDWRKMVVAGLDEVTLSVHGVTKESYEYFMVGASYEKFIEAIAGLTTIKKEFPQFKIRLNYTVNKDNLEELAQFFDAFGKYGFDLLQIRPIQQLGETEYQDFSWDDIYEKYDTIIGRLKTECRERNITCLTPNKHDLVKEENESSMIGEFTYCYVSPRYIWKDDFSPESDSYESYARKIRLGRKLLGNVFRSKSSFAKEKRNLNYEIN